MAQGRHEVEEEKQEQRGKERDHVLNSSGGKYELQRQKGRNGNGREEKQEQREEKQEYNQERYAAASAIDTEYEDDGARPEKG
jgi:hypothetical protein